MESNEWQRLVESTESTYVVDAPAPPDVSVIFIERQFAEAKALGQSRKGGIDLVAATEGLDDDACSKAISILLGVVPELAPPERSETPRVTVPLHAPDRVTAARAVWRLDHRLEVSADSAGVHVGDPREEIVQASLERADIMWLARAIASAQYCRSVFPLRSASCDVDVDRDEHLDPCGTESPATQD